MPFKKSIFNSHDIDTDVTFNNLNCETVTCDTINSQNIIGNIVHAPNTIPVTSLQSNVTTDQLEKLAEINSGSDIVTTTKSQTLTNKTISGSTNTINNVPISGITNLQTTINNIPSNTETLTNKTINFADNTLQNISSLNTVQTLTNKTISGSTNTINNIPISGITNLQTTINNIPSNTETLTNKTIDFNNNTIQNLPNHQDSVDITSNQNITGEKSFENVITNFGKTGQAIQLNLLGTDKKINYSSEFYIQTTSTNPDLLELKNSNNITIFRSKSDGNIAIGLNANTSNPEHILNIDGSSTKCMKLPILNNINMNNITTEGSFCYNSDTKHIHYRTNIKWVDITSHISDNNILSNDSIHTVTNKNIDFNNNTLSNIVSLNTVQTISGSKTFSENLRTIADRVEIGNNNNTYSLRNVNNNQFFGLFDDSIVNGELFGVDNVIFNIPNKAYAINANVVLSENSLGSSIINSSLTSVGKLNNLDVDNLNFNGNSIKQTTSGNMNFHTSDNNRFQIKATGDVRVINLNTGVVKSDNTGVLSSIQNQAISDPLAGDSNENSIAINNILTALRNANIIAT